MHEKHDSEILSTCPISTFQGEKREESRLPCKTAAPLKTRGRLGAVFGSSGRLPVESFRSWTSAGLCCGWHRQQGSSSVFRTQDVVWTCRWRTSAWAFRLRNSSWMKSVNVFLISIWGKQEQNKLLKHLPGIYIRKNDSGFWVWIVRTMRNLKSVIFQHFWKKHQHLVVLF